MKTQIFDPSMKKKKKKKKTPFDLDAALGGETQSEEPSAETPSADDTNTDLGSTPAEQESEPVAETKPEKKEKSATDNCNSVFQSWKMRRRKKNFFFFS